MATTDNKTAMTNGRDLHDQRDGPNDNFEEESFLEMTLQEHLEELRTRILYITITVLVAIVVSFFLLTDPVLKAVADKANVPESGILTISPTEGFVTYFKLSLYIALAISMPVIVYQLVAFIAPGLTRDERRVVYMSLPVVSLFFVTGMAFAFFLVIPRALAWLSGFKSGIFAWDPRASELISFYVRFMLGVGIAFQLPIVMFLLAKLRIVSARRMASAWKIAIILVMIASAIITPTPDPVNMMLVAVPLFGLYVMGVFFAKLARPTEPLRG